jgi:hypothetical protein
MYTQNMDEKNRFTAIFGWQNNASEAPCMANIDEGVAFGGWVDCQCV